MVLAWKGFVLAGFLIAAVSCSDALGFREQSAEVEFGNERTYEFQLASKLGFISGAYVHIAVWQ